MRFLLSTAVHTVVMAGIAIPAGDQAVANDGCAVSIRTTTAFVVSHAKVRRLALFLLAFHTAYDRTQRIVSLHLAAFCLLNDVEWTGKLIEWACTECGSSNPPAEVKTSLSPHDCRVDIVERARTSHMRMHFRGDTL